MPPVFTNRFLWIGTAITLAMLGGCQKDEETPVEPETPPPSGSTFVLGPSVEEVTQAVGPGGGTISVTGQGSSLGGLKIEVPSGAHASTRTYTVSSAQVHSYQLPQDFAPISPLITIGNGGGYADELIRLSIPIKKNADEFAAVFFYDDQKDQFECLPIIALTNTSITVATRHFAYSDLVNSGKRSWQRGAAVTGGFARMVVLSIKESILESKPTMTTGFTPGVDDWEFSNYGSYIAPGGHCAGQSMSMIWYYYEQRVNGGTPLYHRYDNILIPQGTDDGLWHDNPLGYRLASVIQERMQWSAKTRVWIEEFQGTDASITWPLFLTSMLVTGMPQFVYVARTIEAHAIIVHKISPATGTMYICDPNFPASERQITFNGAAFDPYSTKANAEEPDEKAYVTVKYFPITSIIGWSAIADVWADFDAGIVGTDEFPEYDLTLVLSGGGSTLETNFSTTADTMYPRISVLPYPTCWLYDENGTFLASQGDKGAFYVLKQGQHRYGLYVGASSAEGAQQRYVDFQWIWVNKSDLYKGVVISFAPRDAYQPFMTDTKGNMIPGLTFSNGRPDSLGSRFPLSWPTDTVFTAQFAGSDLLGVPITVSIEGALDTLAKVISRCSATTIWTNLPGATKTTWHLTLANIPYTLEADGLRSSIPDPSPEAYITNISHEIIIDYGKPTARAVSLASVNWPNAVLQVFLSEL